MESSKPHAALISSPGMGHLVPVLELGKRLVMVHGLEATVLIVTTHGGSPAESQLLLPSIDVPKLHVVELPPIDISGQVEPTAKLVTQLAVMMREAVPVIRSALSDMNPRPSMLVVDFFGTESLEIADEFGMTKYVYCTCTAWVTALTAYCPVLDKEIVGEYVDQEQPLRLPGCKLVRPEDVVDPMLHRNDQQYIEYRRIGFEFSLSDGILVNTWKDMEGTSLEALCGNDIVNQPIYPIGPLTKSTEPTGLTIELSEWLNRQPNESVLYVSFGSGGTLSAEQITELAWGLELSKQRFVWVLRLPIEGSADASFFTSGNGPEDLNWDFGLPDGFLSRTSEVGVVVPFWASQLKILSHPSIGGFLSHCGWNSTLESITNGVPMIAWPLYAEQRLNATMLTEELGVAVRPKVLPAKKVVRREEIEEMVRNVMEYEKGEEMRKKMKELKNSGDNALIEGGSSYKSMCELIKDSQVIIESRQIQDLQL